LCSGVFTTSVTLFPAMGFQYVFVPANVNEPMEELEYPDDIQDLQKDTFRTFIEQFFSKKGEAVDKAVLMAQLQERTGVNLKEKSESGWEWGATTKPAGRVTSVCASRGAAGLCVCDTPSLSVWSADCDSQCR